MRISPFAADYVRKRTAERMDDVCRVWKPGPPVLDRNTGKTRRDDSQVKYEGPCRLWEVTSGSQALLGDQQLVFSQSYLSLPYNSVVPESDDVVKIVKSVDNDLQGRTVRVVSVVRGGGLRASRRFMVQVIDSEKASW